jgi:hypothetical protein
MNKGLIAIFVLAIILAGVFGYFYYKYDYNVDYEESYSNVSVFAYHNDKQLAIPYVINISNGESLSGNTFEQGGSFSQIKVNNSFTVFNNDTKYYRDIKTFANDKEESHKISLMLVQPGNMSIYKYGIFGFDKIINLKTSIIGELRDVKLCMDWSVHVIRSEISNYSSFEDDNYFKCYNIGTLADEDVSFEISYKIFGIVDKNDYIKVYFIDQLNNINEYIIKFDDNIYFD